MVKCLRIEEYARMSAVPECTVHLAGPAVDVYREELEAIWGSPTPFLPHTCRYARGEVVAQLAQKYLSLSPQELLSLGRDSDLAAEKVEICYLQSHGALTIKERTQGSLSD
jgi:hypothetical protein